MSVERPLTPGAPLAPFTGALQIEFAPDSGIVTPTEDGGVLVDLAPEQDAVSVSHDDNLAEFMDANELTLLASELIRDFEDDRDSRKDWEKAYMEGLDLLGLKFEERDKPWAGACGVFHPMLAEAVVRFQAQTIQEIFPASGPCRVKIAGDKAIERIQQAGRVEQYLNYLTVEEMVEYRNETERLLFSLPLAGSAFRKVYFDQTQQRPCAMFIPAEDFVVSYGTADLATCERATHVMKRTQNWVRKLQVAGFYRDIELPAPTADHTEIRRKYDKLTGSEENFDTDPRHTLLEMLVDLDLPGFEDRQDGVPTGVALPYVVTLDKSSREVLAIRRNWLADDPHKRRREHFVHYQYVPGLGFYGFGLVHMIGGLSKSATSLLRQLVDSGTLANLPGGLKTRGLRIKGDNSPISPGEFRDVDVPSGAIRDNITFLPYKEPSGVLYQLLGDIVMAGQKFASAADVKASDINGEAPVGTTLAILEREMKVLSAVQARVHAAMGKELQLLAQIVKDFGPEEYPFDTGGEYTIAEDFDERIDILPVSDPNAGTMAQRIMQYQAALQLSAQSPDMYDLPLLHRQMLEVLGIQDAAKIVPLDEEMIATDPVSENMNLLNGKPVKAFLHQDHDAHIQTHMAASQNPQLQELLGKNPKVKGIIGAFFDHVTEHVAMAYRQRIEQELGVHLPAPEEALPEDVEVRLSRLVAPAAAQLTGKSQRMQQAEKNAAMQKDPIVQMQMKELEIKQQKVQADAQADQLQAQTEAQKADARLQLEREKLSMQERQAQAKLTAEVVLKQMQQQRENSRLQLDAQRQQVEQERQFTKEQLESFRLGMELAERILQQVNSSEEQPDRDD